MFGDLKSFIYDWIITKYILIYRKQYTEIRNKIYAIEGNCSRVHVSNLLDILEVLKFCRSRIFKWKENRDGRGGGGLTLLNASFPLLFSSTHTSAVLATDFLT